MLNLRVVVVVVVVAVPSPTMALTASWTVGLLALTPIKEKLDMLAAGEDTGDLICANQRVSHFSWKIELSSLVERSISSVSSNILRGNPTWIAKEPRAST
jgi:hypothetical protein